MVQAIRLEFFKMRGRCFGLLLLLCLLVQGAWLWWTFKSMSHLEIIQGWQHYLYQLPVLNAILLPVLMAVMASRAAEIEHKGTMLRQLYTIQPAGKLLLCKLLYGGWYLALLLAGQLLTMLLIGLYKGFYGPIPWGYFGCYLLFTFVITWCIYLVQLLLSLFITNQLIPLLVGAAGSFCGLFSLFFQQYWFSRLILWTYYSQLFLCGMNWDKETRITEMYWITPDWAGFFLLTAGFLLTIVVGWRLLERKEC